MLHGQRSAHILWIGIVSATLLLGNRWSIHTSAARAAASPGVVCWPEPTGLLPSVRPGPPTFGFAADRPLLDPGGAVAGVALRVRPSP